MEKVKIGFVPCHRKHWHTHWAIEMRARTVKALKAIPFIEVVAPDAALVPDGLVSDDSDAERVIELFRREKVWGVLLGTMNFGDEVAAAVTANALRLPTMLFATKEGPFTEDNDRLSDSFCGTLSVSSALVRRKLPFTFGGILFPEEKQFAEQVERFARACCVHHAFYDAKVGLVGHRPVRFETCSYNEHYLIERFRQRVVPLEMIAAVEMAKAMADVDAIAAIVKDVTSKAEVHVSDESLDHGARFEETIYRWAKRDGLACVAVSCWPAIMQYYHTNACIALGRLTERGLMAACEADVHGALSMLVQHAAMLRDAVPHFIDWTIQHQDDPNVFLAWHCGNAPMCLNREGGHIHVRGQGQDPASWKGTAEFGLKEGLVTLTRLVEYDGHFKMLVTTGQVEPDQRELRGSWAWVRVADLAGLYRRLVEEGFIHHASMIYGDCTGPIIDFCKFAGIETVVV